MKKVLVAIVAVGFVLGAWRWTRGPAAERSEKSLVLNRIWIDHMPQSEKDTHNAFALWRPESFGVFADRNRWRVDLERFTYEIDGDQVRAVWPLSGKRATLTIKAERCNVDQWDFCLEIQGAPTGIQRYYSRKGWERKDRQSVDEQLANVAFE